MEFFNFDPNDFQVLEDVEFDETLQRPEKIRFYTLTEQTTDAYEKMMPKGRVTRFQRELIQKEIERLKDLYQQYVIAMPEDYLLREPEYGRTFSWIHPVYASPATKEYIWETAWEPLYDNITLPSFYPRLLNALPRPYSDETTGRPYDIEDITEFVNQEGINPNRALPKYQVPRTQYHENKTIDILRVPADGTEDVVNFVGYYLDKRVLDIPNPFPEHPFLKANEAIFFESTATLKDVVPSLDAIMTHGVPVTKDPYGVAMPYLKLYDIKLQDIPWSSWKSKFPSVDVVKDVEPGEPIEFPKPAQLAPPKNVIDAYGSPYSNGVSVRRWLMDQVDGGGLIMSLLLSQVIDNGSVQSIPGIDIEKASYPETTIEECSLIGTTFQDFVVKGNLRRKWTTKKDNDVIAMQCVPQEFIKQERAQVGYLNRKPWSESTGDDIKKAYVTRMEEVRRIPETVEKEVKPPKTPMRPDSMRRAEVLAVFNDERRFSDDKVRDIRELLRETTKNMNVYSDPDGLFVFCEHSIAILDGDLALDRNKFYDVWAARVDGSRVCKFCGEHINNDVFAEQAEFDEAGFLIKHTESLEQKGFHGAAIASFTTGLQGIQPMFLQGNPHDETVFLLLSLLQVLPTADKVEPLLKIGRTIAAAQFSKGSADQIAKFSGMMGIATTAILLQSHIPTLVPRRAFGPKALVLTGYPRDSDKPGDYTIADSLLLVFRKTFEAFPTSFKGASQQVIRAILNKPTEIKNGVIALLSAKSPLMKGDVPTLLANAKAYHAEQPRVEVPRTLIPVMFPPKELGVINSFVECPSARPIWTSGRPPQVVQPVVPLRTGLFPSRLARQVVAPVSRREVPTAIGKAEIRERLANEKKAQIKIPIRDAYRTNIAVASRLSDMFLLGEPIRTVDPKQSEAELRDIGRGFVVESIVAIQKDVVKRTKLEEQRTRDVALYTLLADYNEEKAQVNKLRASERIKFVQRMAQKTDQDREIIGELLKIGMAPYIMTNRDREELAREAERLREEVFREDVILEDADVGVGQPHDVFDQGDEDRRGADNGDYGDYVATPSNDGRDAVQPGIGDDRERSI